MIAKYIVLSDTTTAASNNILRTCIQELLLISKKIIVFLHTLPASNKVLIRYKVYSSDLREYLCTSCRYTEAFENFNVDPAPIKNIELSYQVVSPY